MFKLGQNIICINANPGTGWMGNVLEGGKIYKVKDVLSCTCGSSLVNLGFKKCMHPGEKTECNCGFIYWGPWFFSTRFRPLDSLDRELDEIEEGWKEEGVYVEESLLVEDGM